MHDVRLNDVSFQQPQAGSELAPCPAALEGARRISLSDVEKADDLANVLQHRLGDGGGLFSASLQN